MDHFVIVREERYRLVREVQYAAPPQEDPVKTSERKRAKEKALADYQKKNYNQQVGHKGPYLPVDIAHPPLKKHGGVMDCNEAAKLFGGVVITDYGRNKSTLRA
ncbi:hypothetical protein TIFTF001_018383 [Ficus carica]|uniref:Uncharacterized protein n=1 Tax=Ficus carica TaxID=3494 RepID=A0AA88AN82_FICCA|nr:hypothetical protein TIFTF001_018383 [Ficus carica]